MALLTANRFFSAFSKIATKRTFVSLLFLKLNQSRNTKKNIFWGVFLQKQKTCSFGSIFLNSNFEFVFLHLFFMEKEAPCQFSQKNINIQAPSKFLEMKTLPRVCTPSRATSACRKFIFGLLKLDLTFGQVPSSVRSKK